MKFLDARRGRQRSPGQIDPKTDCLYRIHGYPTVMDTYSTYVVWNLIDSNDATMWVSNSWAAAYPWCKLDVGSPKFITKSRLFQPSGDGRATQYKIEASNDDSTYDLIYTSPSGIATEEHIAYFPLLKYRYWRWTALAINHIYGWSLYSAELFGPTA